MAKIVIIAPAEAQSDVDDAAKMLRGNGHDVDVEQPVPKNLLHIVLGLLGPNAYGFGPGYAYAPGPDADAADGEGDDEGAVEDEITSDPIDGADGATDFDGAADIDIPDAGADDFNFEGLTVDGEAVKVVITEKWDHSALLVQDLNLGAKTSYRLNEATFSFWPADQQKPMQRVDVGHKNVHTSVEVEIAIEEGVVEPTLFVGKDLAEVLGMGKKNTSWKNLKDGWSAVYDFDDGKSQIEIDKVGPPYQVTVIASKKRETHKWSAKEIEAFLKEKNAKFSHSRDHNN